ncbi:hypothetical protein [Erythrobacter sp.]|jgi:hypothetical protein|uniref:hypothetical protein n=1 Tax=Erythrobacter sp. TaxID=1042 RepID=UPI002EA65124|nr:hypothetical protein [Erythrobacter sp.]
MNWECEMRRNGPTAILLVALAAALAGCGAREPLEPAPGATLPPPGYGAVDRPEAEQLLELPTLAAPERSVELRRRSEEREDDPFDLPPD